jgi:hypothetical protein
MGLSRTHPLLPGRGLASRSVGVRAGSNAAFTISAGVRLSDCARRTSPSSAAGAGQCQSVDQAAVVDHELLRGERTILCPRSTKGTSERSSFRYRC